jgi:heterotetrameric sarcosine oxidase gamma subunit
VPAVDALGLRCESGRVTIGTSRGRPVECWQIAPDECLLVGDAPFGVPTAPECATLTDLSSGFVALELVGPRATTVLEEVCALDVREHSFADRSVASAPVANARAIVTRFDRADVRAYTLMVDRDLGEYLWDVLLHIGERHGLMPVGSLVVEELASEPVAVEPGVR